MFIKCFSDFLLGYIYDSLGLKDGPIFVEI